MWRYFSLRLMGVVGGMLALNFAISQTLQNNLPSAALGWGMVAVGLWIFFIGNKGIKGMSVKAQKVKAELEAVLQFPGQLLDIGPKWEAIILLGVGFALVASLIGKFTLGMMQVTSPFPVVVSAIGFIGLVGLLVRHVRLALLAISHGYLVRFDPTGLSIAGRGQMPWSAIRGIDLRVHETEVGPQHSLALAVDPAFNLGGNSILKALRHFWGAVAVERGKDILDIPCDLLRIEPQFMVHAAKTLSDQCGAKRLQNWRCTQPIDEAMRLAEATDRAEAADDRLQSLLGLTERMGRETDPDAEELKKLDREVAAAFVESQTALGNQIKLFEADAKRMQKQSKAAVWVAVALIALGISAICLMILLVIWK